MTDNSGFWELECYALRQRVEELEWENTSLKNEIYTLKISNNVLITSKAQLVEGLREIPGLAAEGIGKDREDLLKLLGRIRGLALSLLEGGSDE